MREYPFRSQSEPHSQVDSWCFKQEYWATSIVKHSGLRLHVRMLKENGLLFDCVLIPLGFPTSAQTSICEQRRPPWPKPGYVSLGSSVEIDYTPRLPRTATSCFHCAHPHSSDEPMQSRPCKGILKEQDLYS